VAAIDVGRNVVLVGEQQCVYAAGLQAAEVSWVGAPEAEEFAATCKIRYRHQPVGCQVRLLAGDRCIVSFDQPQKSVTPGQALVFYREDEVLGGGRIVNSL
jgi:tRNA-specific 2-thiouridylase